MSGWFDEFVEEILSNNVLRSFLFLSNAGWDKSKLAPIAVGESDGFDSHTDNSGLSITGEL